jgi:hypothetical protein
MQHNTIRGGNTSAIIMWDEGGSQHHDVLVDANLMAGGAYTLYCPRQDATNVRIVNNRFGSYVFGYANSCTPGHVAQWSSNVRDSDGVTLPAA